MRLRSYAALTTLQEQPHGNVLTVPAGAASPPQQPAAPAARLETRKARFQSAVVASRFQRHSACEQVQAGRSPARSTTCTRPSRSALSSDAASLNPQLSSELSSESSAAAPAVATEGVTVESCTVTMTGVAAASAVSGAVSASSPGIAANCRRLVALADDRLGGAAGPSWAAALGDEDTSASMSGRV